MGLLLVDAIARVPPDHADASGEDLLVVAISVTDANGNPRDGLTKDSVRFTLVTGGLTGAVDDLLNIASGSGLYGLEFGAGQPQTAGGSFPSFLNSDNVFAVVISDAGDAGQTLVRVTVTGR
jgi:hypothetical protein